MVLIWKASTWEMNPSVDRDVIRQAYEDDPSAAAAEYGGEFRSDVEDFLTIEDLEPVIVSGRTVIEPMPHARYFAFCDPSGGKADSFTLAIAHDSGRSKPFKWRGPRGMVTCGDPARIQLELQNRARLDSGKIVLDYLREWRPPFNTETVVEQVCEILRAYGIGKVTGDRYAGGWVSDGFQKHGIFYQPSQRSKSELYLDLLPLISSCRAELLDNPKMVNQLLGLERRTTRLGRDTIDHAPGGHDDICNATAGAVTLAAQTPATIEVRPLAGL